MSEGPFLWVYADLRGWLGSQNDTERSLLSLDGEDSDGG